MPFSSPCPLHPPALHIPLPFTFPGPPFGVHVHGSASQLMWRAPVATADSAAPFTPWFLCGGVRMHDRLLCLPLYPPPMTSASTPGLGAWREAMHICLESGVSMSCSQRQAGIVPFGLAA